MRVEVYTAAVPFCWMHRKVHWGDCDAARVVWFPRFLEWYEEAEENLYDVLGQPRQQLLERLNFGMPRVELHTDFHAPARAGDHVRVGIGSRVENPRRLRHEFEIRAEPSDRLIARGFVRVACVDWTTFKARDLPIEVVELIRNSVFTGNDGTSTGQQS
jgi:YbgC/YbaW family acyl-CoA thioester hydrolase